MNNTFELDYQVAADIELGIELPTSLMVEEWLLLAFKHVQYDKSAELCVRIVTDQESQTLNHTYRGKDCATNVLSFESDIPDYIENNHIGDLVICASVVAYEAKMQQKPSMNHWAHMCIHGLLHLLGHDHIKEKEAVKMESLEATILAELGIDDPYQVK